MSDDPRGKTLWEMFLDWIRGDDTPSGSPASPSTPAVETIGEPPQPNPLGWEVGASVHLSPDNGEGFTEPVTVWDICQVVRRIAGRTFTFVDYVIQPHGDRGRVRLRCVPDSSGESRLLLELADTFPCDDGFLEVVNDDTGVFDITNDETQETDRFERINGVQGPYHAMVRSGKSVTQIDYWDWARTDGDGDEEFVFVEHRKQAGQIEIWRGWRLIE